MTRTEFENLKFGDVVYKNNGQGWVFLNSYSDCEDNTKLNAVNPFGDIESIRFIDVSLEKPKKKVKKEIIRYVSDNCLVDFNKSIEYDGVILMVSEDPAWNNKITITYETEE